MMNNMVSPVQVYTAMMAQQGLNKANFGIANANEKRMGLAQSFDPKVSFSSEAGDMFQSQIARIHEQDKKLTLFSVLSETMAKIYEAILNSYNQMMKKRQAQQQPLNFLA